MLFGFDWDVQGVGDRRRRERRVAISPARFQSREITISAYLPRGCRARQPCAAATSLPLWVGLGGTAALRRQLRCAAAAATWRRQARAARRRAASPAAVPWRRRAGASRVGLIIIVGARFGAGVSAEQYVDSIALLRIASISALMRSCTESSSMMHARSSAAAVATSLVIVAASRRVAVASS